RGDRSAIVFLVGSLLLVIIAIPDILVGLGIDNPLEGTSPFAILAFAIALAVVLQMHVGAQQRAIAASQLELRGLNTELRVQLEKRSRELADAVKRSPSVPVPAALSIGDVVDRYQI